MLQVSEKAKKGKRKALLVTAKGEAPVVPNRPDEPSPLPVAKSPAVPPRSSTSNTEPSAAAAAPTADLGEQQETQRPKSPAFQINIPTSISGPAYEPQSLEGEAFERMRMDPEIQTTRRVFILGVGGTLLLILLASLAHFFVPATPQEASPAPVKAVITPPKVSRLPPNTIGLMHGSDEADKTEREKPKEIKFDTKSLDLGTQRQREPLPPTEPVRMPALR